MPPADTIPLSDDLEPQPPMPAGLSADVEYGIQMQAWGLARIVREIRSLRTEIKGRRDSEGVVGRAFDWFEKLPKAVQLGAAIILSQIALQWSGAIYQKVTGVIPPQVTIPTFVTGAAAGTSLPPASPAHVSAPPPSADPAPTKDATGGNGDPAHLSFIAPDLDARPTP